MGWKCTHVKARSEQIVTVKCKRELASVTADFEPKKIRGVQGFYASRARIIPNMDGVFQIALLNVGESDVRISGRKFMGMIHPVVDDERNVNVTAKLQEIKYGDNLTQAQRNELEELIKRNKDVFAADPKKPSPTNLTKHHIVTEGAQPIRQKTRRIPNAWQAEVDRQVKEMIDNNIIRKSVSPWNSPVILVKKQDKTTRFVLDFRALNDVTKKDSYPLPHIRDVIDKMEGAQFWSTLDAASAYWSMPMNEEDKEKTAFSVPRGKWEFNVTPYGLCNAGASYQRMMDICLARLPSDRVLAYMDDIVIFSRSLGEHKQLLEAVFERLRKANITLKASKCVIASSSVDFLGYHLSVDGIRPQNRLTTAIQNFQRPGNKKEVKGFMGLAGFYRHFIKDFSKISSPLNALTSDNVVFTWSDECETVFKQLKEVLMSEPVLAFPRLGETFIVEVDGSEKAAGGVLSQIGPDGQFHPVAYYSTSLNKSTQLVDTHHRSVCTRVSD